MADIAESTLEVTLTDDASAVKAQVVTDGSERALVVKPVSSGITLKDTFQLDGLGRLRNSNQRCVFDSKHLRGFTELLFWDSSVATGGTTTINVNASAVDLSTTTTSGSSAIWQTKEYFVHRPGATTLALLSFVLGAATVNVRKRVGLFDANDGIFLEQTTTDVRFVERTSTSGAPVDTNFVAQSAWNVDKLDGTGASGITLNFANVQTMFIDYSWPSGRTRVGFYINGIPYIAHQFQHANSLTLAFLHNPSLPVRFEITNTAAAASATTLQAIASSVYVEDNGNGNSNAIFSANNRATTKTTGNGVPVPMVCIRLKAANNRVPVIPISGSFMLTGNREVFLELWLLRAGGTHTLTGATFNSVHPLSSVEFDVAATALTVGDAVRLGSVYIGQLAKMSTLRSELNLKVCSNIAGTSDILCLTATGIGGIGNGSAGSLSWIEEL